MRPSRNSFSRNERRDSQDLNSEKATGEPNRLSICHQSISDNSNIPLNGSSSSSSPVDSPDSPSLYRPIIFQYKCRGGLFIDDSDNGSDDRNGMMVHDQSDHDGVYVMPQSLSTPKCVGLESRLKKLQELPPMTKDESLRAFMFHSNGNATNNGFGGNNNAPHEEEQMDSNIPKKHHGDGAFSTMAFYGSTDISVLMLRDSKKAEVVAVAPECKLGLTIRETGDTTGGESLSTVRIGPIEISIGNQFEYGEEEAFTNQNKRAIDNLFSKNNKLNKKKNDETQQYTQSTNRGTSRKNIPKQTNAEEGDEDYLKKIIYAFSKTAESMQNNAKLIKDELQDDFPARFVKAGDKIIGNFGKTVLRTSKVIEDVYKMWSDNDDE